MSMKQTIREILKSKGWSAYRLSVATGISQQVLSNWVRKGAKQIGVKQLVLLKRGTGLSWSKLGELIENELDREE